METADIFPVSILTFCMFSRLYCKRSLHISQTQPRKRMCVFISAISSNPLRLRGRLLLLPANEVWGKFIFSLACVISSVHGGGGHAWQGTCMTTNGACVAGACMAGGMCGGGYVWQGGACVAGKTATEAVSTQPTGMHSCSLELDYHNPNSWQV